MVVNLWERIVGSHHESYMKSCLLEYWRLLYLVLLDDGHQRNFGRNFRRKLTVLKPCNWVQSHFEQKKCLGDSQYTYIWCKTIQMYRYWLGVIRGCKYHDWQTQQTPPRFRLLDSQFSQFYCSAAQMTTFATIVCPLIHTCIRCWQRDSQSFSCHLSAHKQFTAAWTAIPRRGFPYRSASQGKAEAVEESLRFLVVLIWVPESPQRYPKTEFWGIGLHVCPAFPVTQRKQS